MLSTTVVLSSGAAAAFGWQGVEKLLTEFAMPVGFVWLVSTTWMGLTWIRRDSRTRWLATAVWVALTAISTGPVPNLWMDHLESLYPPYRAGSEPPLDVLVVLGGGTREGPTRSEVGAAGDRVVYAAQLYFQGHCGHLITTGSSAETLGRDSKSPTEQTIELWTGLGIKRSAISTLPGRNTSEELKSLKANIALYQGKRIGVLSSASHLPRVMRLAQAEGLFDLIPVPANYNGSSWNGMSIHDFVPSARHLEKFSICQREWLGGLVGR